MEKKQQKNYEKGKEKRNAKNIYKVKELVINPITMNKAFFPLTLTPQPRRVSF